MAAASGREAPALNTRLSEEPQLFTLDQALRILRCLHTRSVQEWDAFFRVNVLIRPWLSLAFPPSEVLYLETRDEAPRFQITATSFGLYSTLGPLPTLYTEELLEEARSDESVSRDFLDILNNHLFHLRSLTWHHNRLERRTVESRREDAARIQFCLMGQSDPSLRPPGLPRALLLELLVNRARSAAHLERCLCLTLRRDDVQVEQCVERRVAIPADQRCRLGQANAVLGEDAVLGSQVRDSTGKFRVHILRADEQTMRHFQPGQPGYAALADSIRRFLDAPLEYDLVLHPAEDAVFAPCVWGRNTATGLYLGNPDAFRAVRFWSTGTEG